MFKNKKTKTDSESESENQVFDLTDEDKNFFQKLNFLFLDFSLSLLYCTAMPVHRQLFYPWELYSK